MFKKRMGAFISSKTVFMALALTFLLAKTAFCEEPTFTYYTSGNTKTYYNLSDKILYTYEDDNYFDVLSGHGQGRLTRIDWLNGSGEYLAYNYYGNTLRVREEKSRKESGDGDLRDRTNIYRDESFYKAQNTATDGGNTFVTTCVNNNGRIDAYLVKYGPAGNKLWSNNFIEGTWIHNTAVTMTAGGHVIVAASKWNPATNSEDFYVAMYYSDGTKADFEYTYEMPGNQRLYDVAVIGNYVILTGEDAQGSQSKILTVMLDRAAPEIVGPFCWANTYPPGDGDGHGYTVRTDTLPGGIPAIFIEGEVKFPGSEDYFPYQVRYNTDGTAASEGYDLTPSEGRSDGTTITGRQVSEDTTYDNGSREFYLELGFIPNSDLSILGYEYFDVMDENILVFSYYDPLNNYNSTGGRVIFENGMIGEFKQENGGDVVKPTKAIMPDGAIYWFLWDVTYEGAEHQYVVIENTMSNAWNDYTFTPDLTPYGGNVPNIIDKTKWIEIPGAVDLNGLWLPELGAWPQDGNAVEYPDFPALYYTSGRVNYEKNGDSIQHYLDESFYTSGSHEARQVWNYSTPNNSYQRYNYFPGNSDRLMSLEFYQHDSQSGNQFRYFVEAFYNEKFYPTSQWGSEVSRNDGQGRLYQRRMEDGVETYLKYYEGTDHEAEGTDDLRFGAVMRVIGSYKAYYDTGFVNKKIQLTLLPGSVGPDGSSIEGAVVDFSTGQDGQQWIQQKFVYINGDTIWFIYDNSYNGIINTVLEKTGSGTWNSYTFDPEAPAQDSMDKTKWGNPQYGIGDQTAFVEGYWPTINSGGWEEYCALKNIRLEFPPLSTTDTYDPLDPARVIQRLVHNDYNDVKYTYIWDPVNGKVAEKIYYEKGSVSKLASITHYVNGSDFDIANKGSWGIENEITYYDSGNLRSYQTYYNGLYNRYVFEDSNFYNVDGDRGQGRLLRWEYTDGNGNTNFNEFEYYGDTLNIKKIIRPVWQAGNVVAGSSEEEIFYNENLIGNPRTATDSEGNTIVAALIIGNEYGSPKAYLIKYAPGGAILWRKEFDTDSTSFNVVVAVDGNDNVYVAASTWNGSNTDILVHGYTKDGALAGDYRYDGGEEERVTSIITDSSGNVYIAGERWQRSSPDNTRDLFITKLASDMSSILWSDIYDSGNKDYGGYLTIDSSDNIALHGRSDVFLYEYFKVAYTSAGVVSSAVYDDLEMSPGSSWLGAWETGREYKYIERTGADSVPYITYAYAQGTGKTLINYTTGVEGFPSSFGGMTTFSYINAANEDIGYRAEFDNGAIMEALPISGSDGEWLPMKFEGYDMDDHIGSTWWLFWDTGITIEKTSSGQYFAYSFDINIQSFDEWKLSLAPAALPDPLPALPELGDWTQYQIDNNILVEFPPLSSEYNYESFGQSQQRMIRRFDHNPAMDTSYDCVWDYQEPGQMKMDTSYDYDNDGADELVYTKVYSNGSDYNLDHMSSWNVLSESNGLSGYTQTYTYYAPTGLMESKTLTAPDTFGNTYYHYINENWNAQGYGRVDKKISADGTVYYYKPLLGADFNLDGKVDFLDFQILLDNWQKPNSTHVRGDADGDSKCDFLDFQSLLDYWQISRYVAGSITSFYDANNNVVVSIYPDGHRDIFARPGNICTIEDALRIAKAGDTIYEYDASGNLIGEIDPMAAKLKSDEPLVTESTPLITDAASNASSDNQLIVDGKLAVENEKGDQSRPAGTYTYAAPVTNSKTLKNNLFPNVGK